MTAVRVPATSANLGPGFDAFGVALDLHLVARLVPPEDVRVRSTGEGADELPSGEDNLVWRSYLAFGDAAGVSLPDATILVDNRLPLERGLGSSSAAIVAGLGLARAVSGAPWSDLRLAALAADLEGHPDNVTPAVLGGLTLCARADDGELVVRRVNPHPSLRPVLLVPPWRQSTVGARGVLPSQLPREAVIDQAARAGNLVGALAGLWPMDARLASDHLHEPARLGTMGATADALAQLRVRGVHAWLSGAGPAIAAAIGRDQLEHCRAAAEAHGCTLMVRSWDLSGVVRLPDPGA